MYAYMYVYINMHLYIHKILYKEFTIRSLLMQLQRLTSCKICWRPRRADDLSSSPCLRTSKANGVILVQRSQVRISVQFKGRITLMSQLKDSKQKVFPLIHEESAFLIYSGLYLIRLGLPT